MKVAKNIRKAIVVLLCASMVMTNVLPSFAEGANDSEPVLEEVITDGFHDTEEPVANEVYDEVIEGEANEELLTNEDEEEKNADEVEEVEEDEEAEENEEAEEVEEVEEAAAEEIVEDSEEEPEENSEDELAEEVEDDFEEVEEDSEEAEEDSEEVEENSEEVEDNFEEIEEMEEIDEEDIASPSEIIDEENEDIDNISEEPEEEIEEDAKDLAILGSVASPSDTEEVEETETETEIEEKVEEATPSELEMPMLLGAPLFGTSPNECKIGSTEYATLVDALSAVTTGQTITMLQDVTYGTPLTINNGKTFTIDFDDSSSTHTFKWDVTVGQAYQQDIIIIEGNSNVTVKNMEFLIGTHDEHGNRIFKVNSTGKLTLNNMTLNSGDSIRNTPVQNNGGTVVIDGGNITTNESTNGSIPTAERHNPIVQNLGGTTTFKGNGTYTMQNTGTGAAWLGRVITLPAQSTDADRDSECGTVIIENGTFNTGQIVDVNGKGTITINDATYGTGNGPIIKAFHGGIKSNITINNITTSAMVFSQVIEELETKINFQNGNVKYTPTRFCINQTGSAAMTSVSIKNGKFGPKTGSADIHDEINNLLASGAILTALTGDPDGYTYKVETPTTYTVIFDAKGGTPVPSAQTITSGNKVIKPTNPTKSGYTFVNWYKEEALTNIWNFETDTVNSDITLYAKWEEVIPEYVVTFDAKGGTPVPPAQTIASGDKVTKPTNPTKSGYEFICWSKDTSTQTTNPYDFNTQVTSNFTLYAKWKEVIPQYKVTFNTNGGSSITSVNVKKGELVTKPSNPTKSGYTFVNWYKEEALTNIWDFATDKVNSDITLYAKWETNYTPPSGGGGSSSGGGSSGGSPKVDTNGDILGPSGKEMPQNQAPNLTGNIQVSSWNYNTANAQSADIHYVQGIDSFVRGDNSPVVMEWVGVAANAGARITWYRTDAIGKILKNQFIGTNNGIYYLDNNGMMVTGDYVIDGVTYHFDTTIGANEGRLIV